MKHLNWAFQDNLRHSLQMIISFTEIIYKISVKWFKKRRFGDVPHKWQIRRSILPFLKQPTFYPLNWKMIFSIIHNFYKQSYIDRFIMFVFHVNGMCRWRVVYNQYQNHWSIGIKCHWGRDMSSVRVYSEMSCMLYVLDTLVHNYILYQ